MRRAIGYESRLNSKALEEELSGFERALNRGLREFEKVVGRSSNVISGDDAFKLHEALGFPLEMTKELAQLRGLEVNEERFRERFEDHRRRSRGNS